MARRPSCHFTYQDPGTFLYKKDTTHASTQHTNPNSAIQPTKGTLFTTKPTTTEVNTITKRYPDVAMERSRLE